MVDAAGLRIVFFGTPEFAVPTLEALLRSRHTVAGVVTRADRPRGRGQKTTETPVKARAIAAGLPVLQPERLKDDGFLAAFAAFDPDLVVLAAYGKILTDALLAMPRLGVLNVHASLLPHYRGAAPVHRAVINGDAVTGVTIMRMVKALDAGPMLTVARHPIGIDDTSEEVEHALGQIGAALLGDAVDALAEGPLPEVAQDETAATYAARITKEDGIVDWTQPASRVHNLIRGLYPWPHAYTFYRGRRLILLRSTVLNTVDPESSESAARLKPDPTYEPGTILEAAGDRLVLAAGEGTLAITQIQAEGRRPMSAREFLAGHPLVAGDILTPHA